MESAFIPAMNARSATEEIDMTEIEERIEDERRQTRILQERLECECPDASCPVEHES